MGLKRFIYNRLFNKRQREVIWKAVLYSEHIYRHRGNIDRAAAVRTVINETMRTAAVKQRKYLEQDVARMVKKVQDIANSRIDRLTTDAYWDGKREALQNIRDILKRDLDGKRNSFVGIGVCKVIDKKKCDKCENKDECYTRQAVDEVEQEDNTREIKIEDNDLKSEDDDTKEGQQGE